MNTGRARGVNTLMGQRSERDKIAHLLRRFGLGASEAEIEYYGANGLQGAIEKLLNYEDSDEGFDVELDAFAQPNNQRVNIRGVQAWWILRLLVTRRPLQEKMTLFWHDHFATSASKVNAPLMMYQQNELLRKHATGKFETLVLEVSKDPAMLFWLDNQYNVRGKPNENFARELMELFTLGIGHYSEKDIQEASRAFTGWSIGLIRANQRPAEQNRYVQATYQFRPALHDFGEKTVLGETGNFGGEDVIALLCRQARCSIYIVEKLWEWFAYPKPEQSLLNRLATNFRNSGLDVKALLRDIMESEEFYSAKAQRAIYKNPVDFVIATARQLGVGQLAMSAARPSDPNAPQGLRRYQGVTNALQQGLDGMGMELLFPPDVAGWDGGSSWVTSATMVERIRWADILFGVAGGGPRGQGLRARAQLRYAAFPLLRGDPSPEGVARKLVSVFDAPLDSAKMPALIEAARSASDGRVTVQNANQTAAAVTRLIFASPEFQMM